MGYGIICLLWIGRLLLFCCHEHFQKKQFLHLGIHSHAIGIGKIPLEAEIGGHCFWIGQKHQNANFLFQNILWFTVNTLMLLSLMIWINLAPVDTMTIHSRYNHKFSNQPVVKYINYIGPSIIACGFISLSLVYMTVGDGGMEWRADDILREVSCNKRKTHKNQAEKIIIDPLVTAMAMATDNLVK